MKKSFTLLLTGILIIIMTIPSSASYYPGIEGGIIDGGSLSDGEIIQFIWELYGIVPEDVSKSTDDATALFAELGILTAINPTWWVNARKGSIDLTNDNAIALKNYAIERYQSGSGLSYENIYFFTEEYITIGSYIYRLIPTKTPYVLGFETNYNGYNTMYLCWLYGDRGVSTYNLDMSAVAGSYFSGASIQTNSGAYQYMYRGSLQFYNGPSNKQYSVDEGLRICASIFKGEIVPEYNAGAINRGSFGNVLDRKKEGELKDADPVIIGEFGNTVIDIQPEKVRELVNGAISGTISNTDVLAQTGTIPLVLEQDKYYPLTDVGVSDIPYEFPDAPASGFTLSGLEELFPFCIPFDIYDMLSVLAAEPEAPKFTWVLPFNGNNYEYEVDLSEFDTVAEVARTAMILCFCLWLAIKTRDLIRG